MPRGYKTPLAKVVEIKNLEADGWSNSEIAELAGVSVATVTRIIGDYWPNGTSPRHSRARRKRTTPPGSSRATPPGRLPWFARLGTWLRG